MAEPRRPPPLVFLSLLGPLLLLLLLCAPQRVESARNIFGRIKEPKVKVHKPTAEVNPKLDHIPFDPLVEEFEERQDDRAWEKEYFKKHYEEMRKKKMEYLKQHHRGQFQHGGDGHDPHDPHHVKYRHRFEDHHLLHDSQHHDSNHQNWGHHDAEHHNTEHHDAEHHGDSEHHDADENQGLGDENHFGGDYNQLYEDENLVDGSPEYGEDHEDPDSETYEDPNDFFDEEKFNLTTRLTELFPLIDLNPVDGIISLDELSAWHLAIGRKSSLHRTDREMKELDKNVDGFVTLKEFLKDDTPGEQIKTEWEDHEKNWVRVSTTQFPLVDLDKDGKLNRTELNDLLHPEDSEIPELLKSVREEEIRNRDEDGDGKLGWEDFHKNVVNDLFETFEYDDVEHHEFHKPLSHHDPHADSASRLNSLLHLGRKNEKEAKSRAMFLELDKNKNLFLEEDELIPIMEKLAPGEKYYSREQASNLIEQADDDHDGKLSKDEMINNPYVFYTTAYESHYNQANNDYTHDEF